MGKRADLAISADRASKIATLAENIADHYCPIGTVFPETIIRGEGIQIVYGRYANEFDGIIEHKTDQFEIRCNLDRQNLPDSPRGRFTLAHELGHYFIDEHREALVTRVIAPHPSFSDDPSRQARREQEANLFASHLLMPNKRYTAFLRRARKRLSGIVDTAEKFQVSITGAAIRFVDDEVEPSIIIYWSRTDDRWEWPSRKFREADYGPLVKAITKLPKNSPTRICEALNGERSGVIGKKTPASNWFPSLQKAPEKLFQLREEAFNLGRYGLLILLTVPRVIES
jgi:Zn-dependent peptidase ImmA (M78 family)